MNILSIGNSFSQDAQRYLHQIARSDGAELHVFNLYIGGCPLFRHYQNMLSEEKAYTLEMNGCSTNFKVSLKEALLNRNWDIVTVQQRSLDSTNYETYQPYLNQLVQYIRLCVPKAKIAFHRTWAYEQDSQKLNAVMGYQNHRDMFADIVKASEKAAEDIKADYIIPSGEVLQALLANGIARVHRDTFHASLGLGRYALGLIWYRILTGKEITTNTFTDFDEEVTDEQIAIAKKCVSEIADRFAM